MPVVGVAMVAMGAAQIVGGALTAIQMIGAVSSIIGGIGAITGNKTMMKIGAIGSIVSTVGSFATSQGWIGAQSAADSASAAASEVGATEVLKNAPSIGAPDPSGEIAQSVSSGGYGVDPNFNAMDARLAQGQTPGLMGEGLETSGITSMVTQQSELVPGLMDSAKQPIESLDIEPPQTPAIEPPSADVSGYGVDPNVNAMDVRLKFGQTPGAPGELVDLGGGFKSKEGGILGTIKKFNSFLKDNKELAHVGGKFLEGMFDEEAKARAKYYKQRGALDETQAEVLRRQMANASAIPDSRFRNQQTRPIFNQTRTQYSGVGLMNAPRRG